MAINPVLQTGLLNQSSAQVIDGSLKFDDNYLSRTPGSQGNLKSWTWSAWVKPDRVSGNLQQLFEAKSGGTSYDAIYFTSGQALSYDLYRSSQQALKTTNRVFRDTGWYHIVVVYDAGNSTADDRVRIYVNGERETSFSSSTNPDTTDNSFINDNGVVHQIGDGQAGSQEYDGRLSQVYLIDAQALDASYFGFTDPLTNTWRPKKFTGAFTSDYTGVFAPYSASARLSDFVSVGTVAEDATGYTLPMSNPSHYGGKVLNCGSGGFYVETVNSATEDFFMGCWIKIDTLVAGNQMGINISSSYKYFELRSGGVIGIRHIGGSRADSSATSVADGNWHHIALSRVGSTLYGFVDGTSVVTTTSGVSGNTIGANEQFNFFGDPNASSGYNLDGQLIDSFVYIGQGQSSNFSVPTAPLVDNSGSINHYSGFSDTQLYYASPLVTVSGSTPNGLANYNGRNSFYLPFDGNSPIGEDKSGNGNNWTPVNFGGSNSLEKATGALPILNTTQGGTQAGVGVFGSKENRYYTLTGSSGSGTGYVFENEGTKPTLNMIRGVTYTFDYSAASSHPFRFATAADAAGSTEYTNGTSVSGNVISFTVPHNAPDTLYYYCTNHNGMGNSISVTTDETKADPYAWKNVLALPLFGGANDVSNQINSGTTTKTITAIGNAAASSDTSNFYNGSFEFDGSDDVIRSASNADFAFGTDDFTGEGWFSWDDLSAPNTIQVLWSIGASGVTEIGIYYVPGSTQFQVDIDESIRGTFSYSISTGKWYHIAITRSSSNVYRFYVDGISQGTFTHSYTQVANQLNVGGIDWGGGNYGFRGYLQDFRIYKGVAKYTENFIPAATSPDILPDTPSGVSGSSKLTKITDGAVHFDGTGDFLSLANSTDTNFGSGDFTIECYAYFTSVSAETLLGQWENGSNRRSWLLQVNSGTLSSYLSADGTSSGMKRIDSTSGVITTNRWYHLAYARSGDTMRMFIDGEQVGSVDVSGFTNYANTNDGFQVGSQTAAGANLMNGFISNARIIKGTGLYTSSFTPPTRALTNVTNTKLLCCQSNTSATEGAVKPGSITANGNAAANNFNPFNTNINTVRGQETGYATWNPLNGPTNVTYSDGNLSGSQSSTDTKPITANVASPSGKYYCEIIWESGSYFRVGIQNVNVLSSDFGGDANGIRWESNSGNVTNAGGTSHTSTVSTYAVDDVLGIAWDNDNGRFYVSKNGVWQGGHHPSYSTNPIVSYTAGLPFTAACTTGTDAISFKANFGQKPFKYTPPDGFQPLNLANIRPETVIVHPDKFVKATIGNFDTQKTHVTGFKPDLIWFKSRNNSDAHFLQDSVRGANSYLIPSSANGAGTFPQGGQYAVTSFNSNGWTQGSYGPVSNSQMVAWTWKAGGGKPSGGGFFKDDVEYASAAAAGLDGGSINPTGASVGTKQGFSITTITTPSSAGAYTVSHGLTQAPQFIIYRIYDQSMSWYVWHQGYGAANQYTLLNNTNSANSGTYVFNNTLPTASVITDYASNSLHHNEGRAMIYYSWHDVPGLQKFGTFEGNGSATGPFVELGFKPSLIITKNIDNYGTNYDWCIYDNARSTFNPNDKFLCSNLDKQENVRGDGNTDNARYVDFLSNGFKIRNDSSPMNLNAHTIIYAAWAETPPVNLFGTSATAR